MMKNLKETVAFLRSRGIDDAEVGIVLGTGLGNLVTKIKVIKELSYNVIPHFPIATVEFHFGKLIYGELGGKKVLALQGRYHYYEGYTMEQVVFPVRVMKMLGVKYILLSNAAGAINPDMKKGSLMLLDDHINLQPDNPLRGPNYDDLGPRFPDMSAPYDPSLNAKIKEIAKTKEIDLNEGVYVSVMGPNLETRAEYRFLRIIGADAVGMSTVPEVIACNHMGVPCAAISVLTDECDPDNLKPVDIQDIIETAGKAELFLTALLEELVASYG
ncbi:MAG: purine-nucleoside phosphorylase [Flavobacteriales bacterium]|nr:purine-nucleoside phosphorylase [Flavobacteriales bacterium]